MEFHTGISSNTFKHSYIKSPQFYITLLSDLHLMSSATAKRKIKAELDKALSLNSRILLNGDIADLILPKDHKRYTPEAIAEEGQRRNDLVNATVNMVCDFLKPYAQNIDEISEGNHETAVLKYHNIDIIQWIVEKLNRAEGVNIQVGKFMGFVTYFFRHESGGKARKYCIFRSHGTTKSAPVTLGIIEFNRVKVHIEGADLIWLGHNHEVTSHKIAVLYPDHSGHSEYREVRCVRTGGYLMHSQGSYVANLGMLPKPHGGALVELTILSERPKAAKAIEVLVTQ